MEAAWLETLPYWLKSMPDWVINICYDFYKTFIYDNRYVLFAEGLKNTLIITALALLLGLVLGVIVALIRVSWDKNGITMQRGIGKGILYLANAVSKVYLTVIRGTPVVVQIMILYFVIMASTKNKILVGVISFGINSGAYVAEIIRGGIMSTDSGQFEAGRSLGFNYVETMWYIILPQAFKAALPTLVSEFVVLLKETAIAGYVGLQDLTRAGMMVRGVSYVNFMPLLGIAVVYLLIFMFFTWVMGKLERRLRSSDH